MEKKYEILFTDHPEYMIYKDHSCIPLYRIKALKDFSDIKAGDIGGFVHSEDNLSQEGDCWIYDDATVYHHARIEEDAKVRNEATVIGSSIIRGKADIGSNALVEKKSIVEEKVIINGPVRITSFAHIKGSGILSDLEIYTGRVTVFPNNTVHNG
jgi:NDP-sugar pyrophosphorylase family protein